MTQSLASLYAAHIDALRQQWGLYMDHLGYDGIVLYAGDRHPIFLDDKYYSFKINPHFQQWIPLAQPIHSALALRPGHKPQLHLYAPVDHWEQSENRLEDFWTNEITLMPFEQKDALSEMFNGLPRRVAWIGEYPAFAVPESWVHNPKDLLSAIHYGRARKSPYEKENLRGAARGAVAGHKAAERAFHDGASEFEIHMAYLAASEQIEPDLPYQSIICLNENAACLHYRGKRRERIKAAELRSFLIDAGATCRGYLSDVTRSYATRPGIYADLVAAVNDMQQAIVKAARPGVDYVALNHKAHLLIATILRDMDLVSMEPEAMVASGITATFLPHGLGHFIGVQVHDVGGHMASPAGDLRPPPREFPFLRLTRRLEEGHALTIEPGIYFIPALLDRLREHPQRTSINWKAVEALIPYGGVRIEDNILITAGPAENMTRDAWG